MTLDELLDNRFDVVGESEADSRGRVALGRAGARPGRRYQIRVDDDMIILIPVVSIPEREMLVWENPQLAERIRAGIAEAEAGRTVSLGSFSQYLDDDDDLDDEG
jgi:hypothetical protein